MLSVPPCSRFRQGRARSPSGVQDFVAQDQLVFGWRSALLLAALLVVLPLAAALWRSFDNRAANRIMAALLVVLAGVITPWLIGFAGFYDRWRWLTFLPVAQPLLVPPLFLAFVEVATHGQRLTRLRRWFVPGAIFLLVESISFLLPLDAKLAWAEASGRGFGIAESVTLIALFALVLPRAFARVAGYRRALAQQRSDETRFALGWLVRLMVAMSLLWSLWALYALAGSLWRVGYEGFMPLYLAIAATTVWLGIEAWRHGQRGWPAPYDVPTPEPDPGKPARDWAGLGRRWAAALRQTQAHREPGLTLRRAARVVGTNEAYLSRACNEGLGLSFSALVQQLRSDSVAAALDSGSTEDLLTLAHAAGFASKASFNRAFAARFGMPPSVYRRRLISAKKTRMPGGEATGAAASAP